MGAMIPPSRKSCYNFRVTEINRVLDGDTIDVTIDLGFDLFKKERVRANEKVVAAIGLLGSIAVAFIGAGYFAPKADAHMGHDFPTQEWIEKLRDHESKKKRTPLDEMLNNALEDMEFDYGSDDPTKQEVLLQLPSDGD